MAIKVPEILVPKIKTTEPQPPAKPGVDYSVDEELLVQQQEELKKVVQGVTPPIAVPEIAPIVTPPPIEPQEPIMATISEEEKKRGTYFPRAIPEKGLDRGEAKREKQAAAAADLGVKLVGPPTLEGVILPGVRLPEQEGVPGGPIVLGKLTPADPMLYPPEVRGEGPFFVDPSGIVVSLSKGEWVASFPQSGQEVYLTGEETATIWHQVPIFHGGDETPPVEGETPGEYMERTGALPWGATPDVGSEHWVAFTQFTSNLDFVMAATPNDTRLSQPEKNERISQLNDTGRRYYDILVQPGGYEYLLEEQRQRIIQDPTIPTTRVLHVERGWLPGQGKIEGLSLTAFNNARPTWEDVINRTYGENQIDAGVRMTAAILQGWDVNLPDADQMRFMDALHTNYGTEINQAVEEAKGVLRQVQAGVLESKDVPNADVSELARTYLQWITLPENTQKIGGFNNVMRALREEDVGGLSPDLQALLDRGMSHAQVERIAAAGRTGLTPPEVEEEEGVTGRISTTTEDSGNIYDTFIRKSFSGYSTEVINYLLRYYEIFKDKYDATPPVKGDPVVESLRTLFPKEIKALETYNLPVPERLREIARQKGWKEPVQGFLAYLQKLDKNVFESLLPGQARTAMSRWEAA